MYYRFITRFVLATVLLFATSRSDGGSLLPIGIHVAADGNLTVGSTTGEQPEMLGTSAVAGVVPMNNWNDFVITRFKDGADNSSTNLPAPQSVSTSPTPFTLNDSSGNPNVGASYRLVGQRHVQRVRRFGDIRESQCATRQWLARGD